MTQETELNPAPRETLRVQNFAGMKDVTLELSRMNVLIGPSASGKSVCAKLIYFFKESVRRLQQGTRNILELAELRQQEQELFLRYFPLHSWSTEKFKINYTNGDFEASSIGGKDANSVVAISYSGPYHTLRKELVEIERLRSKSRRSKSYGQVLLEINESVLNTIKSTVGARLIEPNNFIPEGRQFFSTIRANTYRLQEANITLDPFVREFGLAYESALEEYLQTGTMELVNGNPRAELFFLLAAQILRGKIGQNQFGSFITHSDGRQVLLSNASSGQQEALPLIVMLWEVIVFKEFAQNSFIEEPEAHLYPTAQKDVVHLMAAVTDLFGSNEGSQYVLTTHSPYILSALNNLMYGGKIVKETPEKKDKVTAILPEAVLIDPANVRAYMMEDGEARSIISEKSGLLAPSEIDGVSNILGAEFNRLLDVEFDDEDDTDEDAA